MTPHAPIETWLSTAGRDGDDDDDGAVPVLDAVRRRWGR